MNLKSFQKRFNANIRQYYKLDGDNLDGPASEKQQEVYDKLVTEMANHIKKSNLQDEDYRTLITVQPDNECFWEFVQEEVENNCVLIV